MEGDSFWKDKKIIVVDDFEMVRNLVMRALRELHCGQIDEAENGAIALKMVTDAAEAGQPYDLIFSDWVMPILNGMEFYEKIKSMEKTKGTPFVMFTAESDQTSVMMAVKAGIKHFMVKPVLKPKLIAKLKEIEGDLNLEAKKRQFNV